MTNPEGFGPSPEELNIEMGGEIKEIIPLETNFSPEHFSERAEAVEETFSEFQTPPAPEEVPTDLNEAGENILEFAGDTAVPAAVLLIVSYGTYKMFEGFRKDKSKR